MDAIIQKEKLLSESNIRNVFTPFSPVHKSELLSGRESEVSSLLASINTPGQHALIYGDRGIGKSSLANVICELAKESLNYSVHIKKCSSSDSFASLVSEILVQLGHDVYRSESIKECSESGGAKVGLPFVGANITSNQKKVIKSDDSSKFSCPSWVAK